MGKIKTHKASAKRFTVTGTGKVKMNHCHHRHNLALDQLKCTRVVVAHRLSTVRHCDRIMVVDGGRIAEQGTYDELIAKNGLFADLVARQRLE